MIDTIKNILEKSINKTVHSISPLSGGDINDVYKITTSSQVYALKVNDFKLYPNMLELEANGLEKLSDSGIKTPSVIKCFTENNHQFLLLEFIEQGIKDNLFWENFAKDLADLHLSKETYFGLNYDNYIGSLKQKNTCHTDWVSFFINCRIIPLLKKAKDSKLLSNHHVFQFKSLFKKLPEMIPSEAPSLLHGDLWSGNLMANDQNLPVFIDPAVYFGNREMDIAMTKLFGGFPLNWIKIYHEINPLNHGWENRIEIYNLYPLLVHLNLFGSSYLPQIENTINQF